METPYGTFHSIAYRDKPTGHAHLALVKGTPTPTQETLVRVHEPLSVLDLLEVSRTTHSWSMPAALEAIAQAESGVMVLLNCGDSAEQLFTQFTALDEPQNRPRRKPDLRTYGMARRSSRMWRGQDAGAGSHAAHAQHDRLRPGSDRLPAHERAGRVKLNILAATPGRGRTPRTLEN